MRRLALVWAALAGLLLVAFGAGEALGLGPVTDPGQRLSAPSVSAAVLGVSLLAGDVVLPVPSSVVMIALGAAFGVVGGAVLSTVGGVASLCLAGWLGRRCLPRVQALVIDDRERVDELVSRYGAAAVLATRPVPVLAESVAMVAAASGMAPVRFMAAGTAGVVPLSVIYAVAGARGGQADGLLLAGILIALSLAGLAVNHVPPSWRPSLLPRRRTA